MIQPLAKLKHTWNQASFTKQEASKKSYCPTGDSYLSLSLPRFVNHPWRGLLALAIQEQTLGPQHPDFARTLSGLGGLYRAQAKYAEAEQFYQRALAIREQVLETL